MKKSFKTNLFSTAIITMSIVTALSTPVSAWGAETRADVFSDGGKKVEVQSTSLANDELELNGTTYLDIEALLEHLGYTATYQADSNTVVYGAKGQTNITLDKTNEKVTSAYGSYSLSAVAGRHYIDLATFGNLTTKTIDEEESNVMQQFGDYTIITTAEGKVLKYSPFVSIKNSSVVAANMFTLNNLFPNYTFTEKSNSVIEAKNNKNSEIKVFTGMEEEKGYYNVIPVFNYLGIAHTLTTANSYLVTDNETGNMRWEASKLPSTEKETVLFVSKALDIQSQSLAQRILSLEDQFYNQKFEPTIVARTMSTVKPNTINPISSEEEEWEEGDQCYTATLDGKQIQFDQPPLNEKGRILVPVRAILEALGAELHWDAKTQTVTATKGSTVIKLVIGSTTAYVNGKPQSLDVPAKILNERTLIPVRFVAENFNLKVDWNQQKQQVILTTIQQPPEQPTTEQPTTEQPTTEQPTTQVQNDNEIPAGAVYVELENGEVAGKFYVKEIDKTIWLGESQSSVEKKLGKPDYSEVNPNISSQIYNYYDNYQIRTIYKNSVLQELRIKVPGYKLAGVTVGKEVTSTPDGWEISSTYAGQITYSTYLKKNDKYVIYLTMHESGKLLSMNLR